MGWGSGRGGVSAGRCSWLVSASAEGGTCQGGRNQQQGRTGGEEGERRLEVSELPDEWSGEGGGGRGEDGKGWNRGGKKRKSGSSEVAAPHANGAAAWEGRGLPVDFPAPTDPPPPAHCSPPSPPPRGKPRAPLPTSLPHGVAAFARHPPASSCKLEPQALPSPGQLLG